MGSTRPSERGDVVSNRYSFATRSTVRFVASGWSLVGRREQLAFIEDVRIAATLDLAPLGRQEDWEDSPDGYPQSAPYAWWRRHDAYETDLDPWGGQLTEKRAATKQHARRVAGETTS
jgi:hypothetical protein